MYIYLIALIGYIFMDVELVRLYVVVNKFSCLNFLTSAACACVSKIFSAVNVLIKCGPNRTFVVSIAYKKYVHYLAAYI